MAIRILVEKLGDLLGDQAHQEDQQHDDGDHERGNGDGASVHGSFTPSRPAADPGSPRLFEELAPDARLPEAVASLQDEGKTVVLVGEGMRPAGLLALRDELRPEAAVSLAALKRAGIEHVVMLTGDNAATARALAAEAGIDRVLAELRPDDKAREIAQLAGGGRVAMVGDGINDAPALATASVGIAMGAMGTDVAIETADVALMGDDLRHVPQAIVHARRARTVMRQNLVLSGAIVVALVPRTGVVEEQE